MVEERVIDDIYDKLVFENSTSAVLNIARDLFDGHAAQIVHRSLNGAPKNYGAVDEPIANDAADKSTCVDSTNVDTDAASPFFDGLFKDDPSAVAGLRLPPHVPYLPGQSMEQKTFKKTPLFRHVMAPSDASDMLSLRFPVSASSAIAFMIYKTKGDYFQKSDINLANNLYPHFKRAFVLRTKLNSDDQLADRAAQKFQLTLKERDIVSCLSHGAYYPEIEDTLKISKNTLKWHLKNIFQKAHVGSVAELLVKLHRK